MKNKPSVEVIASPHFAQSLKQLRKKYRHVADDIKPLIVQLEQGKTPGDQVMGVRSTVFKTRVASSDVKRGKSGGYRVIYYLRTKESVFLVEIYTKGEQSDIRANELQRLVREIESEID